jgi:hypothetical protein
VPFRWATSMNSFAAEYIGASSSASTTSGVSAPSLLLPRLTSAARCVKLLVRGDPALALEHATALFGGENATALFGGENATALFGGRG